MTDFLTGYYSIGLKALQAARAGLSVAGDNVANVNTPGFARRRVELLSGFPQRVRGGQLDLGVDVASIRRAEDRFLQSALEREQGRLGHADESLRGLREIEQTYGTVDDSTILGAYGEFSNSFALLAGDAADPGLRRNAISAAATLAQEIRSSYGRLDEQRRREDQAVESQVVEINRLAGQLADLNQQIRIEEAGGAVASGLRDQRDRVVQELVQRTGGHPASAEGGQTTFSLSGGPTLVTSERALPLAISRDAQGYVRISSSDGQDRTDGLREGELGALLGLRDDSLPARQAELDSIAFDLVTRANAITKASTDLNGDPGGPLFEPDPPPAAGAAASIGVAAALLADPAKLAVSTGGAPGDGAAAIELSQLEETVSATLGLKSPRQFLTAALARAGDDVARTDVETSVSRELFDTLAERKQSVTGVSLDEEAVALIRYQRAFEAASRFIQVLNEVTQVTVNLV